MANVARQKFKKTENSKEQVQTEGEQLVATGVAKSFTIEDDGTNWVLVSVLAQIS